jgi:hypothetical protein
MDKLLEQAAYELRSYYEARYYCNLSMEGICDSHARCGHGLKLGALWRAARREA